MWDIDKLLERAYRKELLEEVAIKELCEKTKELLLSEGNVRQGN
jgi:serine/threonine-protein phosphatase PPG1